ncbi:CopD family protein, partial [Patulibacter sp. NPDC049589]|uniref:copper resistance D family protein n=1 Tax=Patulibacter sp. NPDC049589 TaxID=3154731 RepID=UPI003414EB11
PAAAPGGGGWGEALRPGTLGDVAGTRTGAWFLITAVASAVLAGIAGRVVRTSAGLRGPDAGWAIAATGLVALLVVAPALGGHAVSSSPAWALVPIQIVHVAGMGTWLGGLLGLVLVLPAAIRAVPDGLPRLGLLSATLLRFSPLALGSVGVLTLAGTGLAILHLTTLYDLTDTAYGRAILVKVVLLTAAIGVAVAQREYLVPQLRRLADGEAPAGAEDDDPPAASVVPEGDEEDDADDPPRPPSPETARHVRLALRSEVLLLVAVLAATGALAGYAPPKSLTSGPVAVTRQVRGVELRLTVDPARTGRNALRLTAVGRNGAPLRGGRDLSVRAVPPGRSGGSDVPVDVPVVADGPGRWGATAVPLGTPGGWTVEVRLRLSAFEQVEARFPVRVR